MTDQAKTPAFIFDLDGTLIDSVYQHVLAWRQALEAVGTKEADAPANPFDALDELAPLRAHRAL